MNNGRTWAARLLVAGLLVVNDASLGERPAFDDWAEQQRQAFEQFDQKAIDEYDDFRDLRDREFVRWLQQAWREFEQFKARVRDETPKAKRQPRQDQIQGVSGEKSVSSTVLPSPPPIPLPDEALSLESNTLFATGVPLQFYGHALKVPLHAKLAGITLGQVTPAALADNWRALAQAPYEPTVEALRRWRQELALSDWASVELVQRLAAKVHPTVPSQAALSWFLLTKLGYRVRAGIAAGQLAVLFPSQQTIYGETYYLIEGDAYYSLGGTVVGHLQSYPGNYDSTLTALDLRFAKTLRTAPASLNRELQWQRGDAWHSLSVDYNPHRVAYLERYPQLDLEHYFDAPVDAVTALSLTQNLRPLLTGKSQLDQVNFLLNLVQSSLTYAVDHAQFGEENYLLPEETFYYPAADCEDRAFLFAWLVRELIDLPVIGLIYPGHVATAVALDSVNRPNEHRVRFQGRNYTVADPTYLNSSAGQVMRKFRQVDPQVVPIL